MRQQAPGTATTQDREDRIQDFTLGIFLRAPPRLGGGHQMLNQVPFFVGEVGWVWFSGFHTLMLP